MVASSGLYTNLAAFLDTIAISEIGTELLKVSDNGYNVLVGATAAHPLLFHDYTKHPNILNAACNSTAAGRYQLLHRFYVAYTKLLNLDSFIPVNQDLIAIQQIKESGALSEILIGRFANAVRLCSHIWASLPGNPYGQHANDIDMLQESYLSAGGKLS
jgi:muramidase (phage lysozyme)